MKKNLFLLFTIFFTSLVFAQNVSSAPVAFDSNTIKLFADDLYANGFLDEAATEYKRYLFSENTIDSSAVLSLTEIYRVKKNDNGILWIADSFANCVDANSEFKIRVLQGKIIFFTQDKAQFAEFVATANARLVHGQSTFKTLLDASQFILNKDIANAASLLATQAADNKSLAELKNICSSYKTKSPVAAVALSAILPGAGRWYTGSWRGGFSTLLTVVSLGASAWYTAESYGWQNWRPWVFSGMAVFSYSVELYGSAKSAIRYNDAEYRKILSGAGQAYDTLY